MRKIQNFDELKMAGLSHHVDPLVRHELQTLLELSGGETIDAEYGHVLILEQGDCETTIQTALGRSFDSLLFEGVAYRHECFIGYLAGGGNERIVVLICPEDALTVEWRTLLIKEVSCP